MRLQLGRTLLDLGHAERRAGTDPRATLERARELLLACDAQLYVSETDAELARSE
jgi:hypothetical protein